MSAPKIDRAAQVRAQGVVRVAATLGVQVYEHSRTLACPACGALRRSSSGEDKRGPVGLRDGLGWHCHRCNESGDALTLAVWVITGKAKPSDWAPVWARLADLGLCEPLADAPARPRQPYRTPPPPPPPAPPKRPPGAELAGLWGPARPVGDVAEVRAWLEFRGLDWGDVELYDLARGLLADASAPSWASRGGVPWNRAPQRYQLLLPLYDARGVLASVHARAVALPEVKGGEKAAFPLGLQSGGLVLACPLARRMLAGDVDALELVVRARPDRQPGLIIAEGVPDFLIAATSSSDADELAPAVLGVVSGAWTAEIAARIPDGARITLAIHDDASGEKYVAEILSTLAERMRSGLLAVGRLDPEGATP
jgi:hypothetical protein